MPSLRTAYLLLAVLGAALPYAVFLPFISAHGLNPSEFFGQLLATPVSRFFAADVLVSALAVALLVLGDGRQQRVPHRWLPLLGTFLIGPSFGLPCYLYLRGAKTAA